MQTILYNSGYQYQLAEAYELQLAPLLAPLLPAPLAVPVETDWIQIGVSGELWIKKGYAWNGPSGPTFDTPDFMRGSLVHDALYQLMRLALLDATIYREPADQVLLAICLQDGMPAFRANYVYQGVRLFAASSALVGEDRKVWLAPRPVTQLVINAVEIQVIGG